MRFSGEPCHFDTLGSSEAPRIAAIRESIARGVELAFSFLILLSLLKDHYFVA